MYVKINIKIKNKLYVYYLCTILVIAPLRYRSSLSDVQLSPTIIILISCIHGLNAVQASQAQRLKREREATR